MPRIDHLRTVILSAPYADSDNGEVRAHLPAGRKCCGLLELVCDDGSTGLGEAYLGVFAPGVLRELVALLDDALRGHDADAIGAVLRAATRLTGYWSLQGAARHALSALEIALVDAKAKRLGVPAYDLFGGAAVPDVAVYGSGGDSTTPAGWQAEFDLLSRHGIPLFKIRARAHEVDKVRWCLAEGARRGIRIAVDMCQNLEVPAQGVAEVRAFVAAVGPGLAFLEEPLGPNDLAGYRALRAAIDVPIYGGEIVTTPEELQTRLASGCYDAVQPDATVVGGIGATVQVAQAARTHGVDAVVHAWGSGVCQMANWHAAIAAGSRLAEWAMPAFPLRDALISEAPVLADGRLRLSRAPGLGCRLDAATERACAFTPDAVYRCLPRPETV